MEGSKERTKYAVYWRSIQFLGYKIVWGCSTGFKDKKYRSENRFNMGLLSQNTLNIGVQFDQCFLTHNPVLCILYETSNDGIKTVALLTFMVELISATDSSSVGNW